MIHTLRSDIERLTERWGWAVIRAEALAAHDDTTPEQRLEFSAHTESLLSGLEQLRIILDTHPNRTVTEWGISDGQHVTPYASKEKAQTQIDVFNIHKAEMEFTQTLTLVSREISPWEVSASGENDKGVSINNDHHN